jgi:flagellar hook-length control protein FliK
MCCEGAVASLAISQMPTAQAGTAPAVPQPGTPAEAFLALINRFMAGGDAQPAAPALPAGAGEAAPEEDGGDQDDAPPTQLVAGLFLAGLPVDPASPPAGGADAPAALAPAARPDAGAKPQEPAQGTLPQAPEAADPSALLPAPADIPEDGLLAGDPESTEAGLETGGDGTGPGAAPHARDVAGADAAAGSDAGDGGPDPAVAGQAAQRPAAAPLASATASEPGSMPPTLPVSPAADAEAARRFAEAPAAGEAAAEEAAAAAPAPDEAPAPRADAARTAIADAGSGRQQDARGDERGNQGRQEEREPARRTAEGTDATQASGSRDPQEARAPGPAGAVPAADGAQPPAAGTGKPAVSFVQALETAMQPSDAAALPGSGTVSLRPAGDPAAALPGGQHGHAGQPHPASEMVSVQFARMADTKTDRMTIQLRPVELGGVEVKLDFRTDGTVQAAIVAERAETLDLLQKDARSLEKALNDAGFRTGNEGLSFNLRGDQGGGERNFAGFRQAFGRQHGRSAGGIEGMDADTARQMTFLAGPGTATGSDRVDIRI